MMTMKMRYVSILLLPVFLLGSRCLAIPAQCQTLSNVVPSCICEAALIDNIPDNLKVVINCRRQELTQMPKIDGSSDYLIYEMTLEGNNLQSIPADAFKGLKIQRLDLRNNRLTSIDANAFSGLESDLMELYIVRGDREANVAPPLDSMTNLTGLHTLTLEHFHFNGDVVSLEFDLQPLYSIPIDFLRGYQHLETLIITNTNIPDVGNEAFQMNTKLTRLDLGYNQISTLYDGCFRGLESRLEYLSLRNNPIDQVNVLDNVKELSNLQILQLSEIGLRTIPSAPQFLQNKNSLTTLYLEGNQLTTVGANVFAGAGSSLTTISLSGNQIATMDSQSLAGLSVLQTLDLSQQTIASNQTLTLPASLTQTTLQHLVLTGTPLTEAALWQRVAALTGLRILKVDSTGLNTVPDYALLNLINLQELYMDGNSISNITQAMFAGPRNLANLHLANNQIQTISNCAFHLYHLNPALEVSLIQNPLNCDCKLRWLLKERDAGRIQLIGLETCAEPADKLGQSLINLQPENLTCSSDWTHDTCENFYTTPPPPTTTQKPNVTVSVVNASKDSIKITWVIDQDSADIGYFRVRVTELESNQISISGELPNTQTSYTQGKLMAGKSYSLCVLSYTPKPSSQLINRDCVQSKTTANQSPINSDDTDNETYIIVGTVLGAVVLLVLIAAILYVVFVKKRTKQADLPPQPHMFSPSELPSMGAEAKRFTRPKQPPKVGRALDQEGIKVTVISDGQTRPVSPGGRLSAGSYQYLDQKHVQPLPAAQPSAPPTYANDVRSRDLPAYPVRTSNEDPMAGYYKMGSDAQPAKLPVYSQINY
ncbi:hypothetical protein BaRGS_00001697 [Batillaria attramentaria]|uniref:Fibronectin type-III domain-containing protein n=1 Tax=Batillaria attramentaria TaxID=370345 RepID=A0ABD0M525_9CAEN